MVNGSIFSFLDVEVALKDIYSIGMMRKIFDGLALIDRYYGLRPILKTPVWTQLRYLT